MKTWIYVCNCKEWDRGNTEQRKIESSAWVHGVYYHGPLWKFCPFCGKKLEKVPAYLPEKTEVTP